LENRLEAYGFIFARGGSKGIKNKNIKIFVDKPLIAHSILHAKQVDQIERIIVSTDSKEIAEVALFYGAEVPFLRPKELATDKSPEWDSWKHALNFLQESEGRIPDVMVSIPTTSPLRIPQDITDCINRFKVTNYDGVVGITQSNRSPYFNIVQKRENGTLKVVLDDSGYSRRQDVPSTFDMTTVCYVMKSNFVLKGSSLFNGNIGAIEIPSDRALDIDSELDFKVAEYLYVERNVNAKP
jgi:N-acylneuraminate cytidylyltransferase